MLFKGSEIVEFGGLGGPGGLGNLVFKGSEIVELGGPGGRGNLVFKGSEIVEFGGLGGPGSFRNLSQRWGASPPIFLNGLQGPRGHPDPQNQRSPIP